MLWQPSPLTIIESVAVGDHIYLIGCGGCDPVAGGSSTGRGCCSDGSSGSTNNPHADIIARPEVSACISDSRIPQIEVGKCDSFCGGNALTAVTGHDEVKTRRSR